MAGRGVLISWNLTGAPYPYTQGLCRMRLLGKAAVYPEANEGVSSATSLA